MSLPARCQAATTSFLDLAMKQKLQNFRINLSTETRNKLSMWGKRDSQSAQSGKSGKGGVVQVHSVGALNGKVTTMNDWETAIKIEYDASEKKYITCTSKAEQLFASEKSNAVNRTNIMEKKVMDNRIVRRAAAVKKDTAYRLKVGLNVLKLNAEKLKNEFNQLTKKNLKIKLQEIKAKREVVEASKARDRDMRVANDVLKGVHAVAAEERSLMIDAVASRLDSLYEVATDEYQFGKEQIQTYCLGTRDELVEEKKTVDEIKNKIENRKKRLEAEKKINELENYLNGGKEEGDDTSSSSTR